MIIDKMPNIKINRVNLKYHNQFVKNRNLILVIRKT